MPWPLILLTPDDFRARLDLTGLERLQPGHCAYAPWILEDGHYIKPHLGSHYLNLPLPRRDPIMIVLPDLVNNRFQLWCPDEMAWSSAQSYHGQGWLVAGELPNVTITPSINCVGSYHGFVNLINGAGYISDDCEGRKPSAPSGG